MHKPLVYCTCLQPIPHDTQTNFGTTWTGMRPELICKFHWKLGQNNWSVSSFRLYDSLFQSHFCSQLKVQVTRTIYATRQAGIVIEKPENKQGQQQETRSRDMCWSFVQSRETIWQRERGQQWLNNLVWWVAERLWCWLFRVCGWKWSGDTFQGNREFGVGQIVNHDIETNKVIQLAGSNLLRFAWSVVEPHTNLKDFN